jgi:hypothetical protein
VTATLSNESSYPSSRLRDFYTLLTKLDSSYEDAFNDARWSAAIQSEVNSIQHNCTYILVDLLQEKRANTTKWIFKVKKDSMGKPIKYKVRIIAKGYQQKEGEHFYDIFAPMVCWSTMCAILAMDAQKEWDLHQFDVITAFLNGFIDEDIYVDIPAGFEELGSKGN